MASYARGASSRPAMQPLRMLTTSRASSSSSSSAPRRRQLSPIRLSRYFAPTLKASSSSTGDETLASLQLLLRGGYIRSSSSGVFTLLPPALRMVRAISAIIDDELSAIGASRLAMPNLLPAKLWRQTQRYELMGSELYRLRDRRGGEYVLGPTHEEEVTRLVAGEIDTHRQLPVRVYQVTRKFRDEPRPRMGLLRTREFVMKDMYSFDATTHDAARAYDEVSIAYRNIFDRVFGPHGWVVAEADTGAIGGNKSHEYHVEDPAGEDTLLRCGSCSYAANTEKAVSLPNPNHMPVVAADVRVQLYASIDPKIHDGPMHAVVLPASRALNEVKLTRLVESIQAQAGPVELLYDSADPEAGPMAWDWKDRPEGPLVRYSTLQVLADFECASLEPGELNEALAKSIHTLTSPASVGAASGGGAGVTLAELFPAQFSVEAGAAVAPALTLVDVRMAETDDTCAACRTTRLRATRAIEVGHTFLLGSRYSRALQAGFLPPAQAKLTASAETLPNGRVPFQMGCYGIGVSRILGALAQKAAHDFATAVPNKAGFLWPTRIAPFTAAILVADPRDTRNLDTALQLWQSIIHHASKQDSTVHTLLTNLVHKFQDSTDSNQATAKGLEEVVEQGWSSEEAHEVVIDDRSPAKLGAKLADADLVGYAFRLIVGRHMASSPPQIEVQHLTRSGLTTTLVPLSAFHTHPPHA